MKNLGTTIVSIAIDEDIVAKLNEIVDRSNMVRDAFINRLVMFLRSSDKLLDRLGFHNEDKGRSGDISYGSPPKSPMKILAAALSNPLEVLHIEAEAVHGNGNNLYLVPLAPELHGFACYLDDTDVPGTEAHREAQNEMKTWSEALDHLRL